MISPLARNRLGLVIEPSGHAILNNIIPAWISPSTVPDARE